MTTLAPRASGPPPNGDLTAALLLAGPAVIPGSTPALGVVLGLAACGAGWYGWTRWRRRDTRLNRERQALEERVRLLLDQSPDSVLLVDAEWRIVQANARAVEAHGYAEDELRRLTLRDLRPPEARPVFDLLARGADGSRELAEETVHGRQDGSLFPVRCILRPIAVDGQPGFQVFIRDLSELRRLEGERRRLDRLHAALRQVNQAIAASRGVSEMLGRACTAVAEYGRFPRVWAGWFAPSPDPGRLVPVAAAGDDAPLEPELDWLASSPSIISLRGGQAWVVNDLLAEPGLAEVAAQLEPRSLRVAVLLPLRRGGQVAGGLAIYSAEPGFFGRPETGLLEELAQAISFAVECLDLKAERGE